MAVDLEGQFITLIYLLRW